MRTRKKNLRKDKFWEDTLRYWSETFEASIIIRTYKSKTHEAEYHIIQAKDGTYYCDCWQWKRRKTCWHLTDFLKSKKDDIVTVIEEVVKSIQSA